MTPEAPVPPPHALDTVVFARGLRLSADAPAIDLEVFPGEVFAIAGETGSRTTALVEALAGIRPAAAGSLTICGVAAGRAPHLPATDIGVALGGVAFDRGMRLDEAFRLFAGMRAGDARGASALGAMGLRDIGHRPIDALSPSDFQRLVLAIALVHDPLLFLADEPTRNLDLEGTRRFWRLLDDRRRRGRTSIVAVSRLQDVERVADRVAVVDAGRLLALDSPARLLAGCTTPVSVLFELARPSVTADMLHGLDGAIDPRISDSRYTVNAADGVAVTRALFRLFDQLQIVPTVFHLRRPTLEDAILELRGAGAGS